VPFLFFRAGTSSPSGGSPPESERAATGALNAEMKEVILSPKAHGHLQQSTNADLSRMEPAVIRRMLLEILLIDDFEHAVTGAISVSGGDYVEVIGIAGKGSTVQGDLRGIKIREAEDLRKVE